VGDGSIRGYRRIFELVRAKAVGPKGDRNARRWIKCVKNDRMENTVESDRSMGTSAESLAFGTFSWAAACVVDTGMAKGGSSSPSQSMRVHGSEMHQKYQENSSCNIARFVVCYIFLHTSLLQTEARTENTRASEHVSKNVTEVQSYVIKNTETNISIESIALVS